MKTLLTTLAAALLTLSTTTTVGQTGAGKMKVNTEKSTIFWTGKKVTGEHTGTLGFAEGYVVLNGETPTEMHTVLNMQSIAVTDITDSEMNGRLTGHLHSPDFFSTEAHPTGTFRSTSFEPIEGANDREANYTVTGELTLKGITQQVQFPAFIAVKNGKMVANGRIVIDRTKWDIRYKSNSFFEGLGDKAIYDDIELNFAFLAES